MEIFLDAKINMKNKNNLSNIIGNTYFQVIESFNAYIPIGTYSVDPSLGLNKLWGTLYKQITLSVGDYIHDSYGGVFVTFNKKFHLIKMNISDKILPYQTKNDMEIFPLEKLQLVDNPNNNYYYVISPVIVTAPSQFYGSSVDSIED